jgi:integrase
MWCLKGRDFIMAKRRANGEGNIRKRSDGRWEGRYTAGHHPDGRQIFKNVLAKTRAECKEKLRQAIAAVGEESEPEAPPQDYTVGEWIAVWYENFIRPNLRDTTRNLYESLIRHPHQPAHRRDKVGRPDLSATAKTLQPAEEKRQDSDRPRPAEPRAEQQNRAQRAHAAPLLPQPGGAGKTHFFQPCRWMFTPGERKVGDENPPAGADRAVPSGSGQGQLPRDVFYLELTSGLRRGELLALLWTDVDAANCTISVSKQVIRVNGELRILPPKTKNAVRKIVVPQQAIEHIVHEISMTICF